MVKISYYQSQMEQQNSLGKGGTNLKGVKISEKTVREIRRSLNQQDETKDDAEVRNDFWSMEGVTSFFVVTLNHEFSSTCWKKKQSQSTDIF